VKKNEYDTITYFGLVLANTVGPFPACASGGQEHAVLMSFFPCSGILSREFPVAPLRCRFTAGSVSQVVSLRSGRGRIWGRKGERAKEKVMKWEERVKSKRHKTRKEGG
jgi:hypothetical protein